MEHKTALSYNGKCSVSVRKQKQVKLTAFTLTQHLQTATYPKISRIGIKWSCNSCTLHKRNRHQIGKKGKKQQQPTFSMRFLLTASPPFRVSSLTTIHCNWGSTTETPKGSSSGTISTCKEGLMSCRNSCSLWTRKE